MKFLPAYFRILPKNKFKCRVKKDSKYTGPFLKRLVLLVAVFSCLASSATSQTVTIKGTPQSAANIAPGFRNRVLYLFEINVTGSAAVLTGISGLPVNGSYLTADINPGSGGNRGFRVQYLTDAAYTGNVNSLENISGAVATNLTVAGNSTGSGQTVGGTFGAAQSLPVGKHWLFITVDIATTATSGRTIGIASFAKTIFQFSGTPTVTADPFSASGLQTIHSASLSLAAGVPAAASVERGINHLQLYRLGITATGAATQIGDGNGTANLSFNLAGTVLGTGTTNINNVRAIYSVDSVFDATDQQLSGSFAVAATVSVPSLPVSIPEGQTRYIFLTTNTQPAATIGATLSVTSVSANTNSGTSFAVGGAPANLPASGVQTIGSNVANVTLRGFRTSATTLMQGSKNNVVGGVQVIVTSGVTVLSKLSFNVPSNFSPADYTNFKLWSSANSSFSPATSVLLNTYTSGVSANSQQSYTFPGISSTASLIKDYPYFLPGTNRYYFVTADISPTAVTGVQLGFSFNSTNSNTTNTVIPGNRTIVSPTEAIPVIVLTPQIAITTTMASAPNLPRGATDQILYKTKITVTNDTTSFLSANYLLNTTNYTDISGGYRLYYSASSSFATTTATQVGSAITSSSNAQNLTFTAAAPVPLTIGSDFYLYLVANTNAAATLGNQVVIQSATESNFNFTRGIETASQPAVTQTISGPPAITLTALVLPSENISKGTKSVLIYSAKLVPSVADAQFTGAKFVTASTGLSTGDVSRYRLFFSADSLYDSADTPVGNAIIGAANNQDLIFSSSQPVRIELGSKGFLLLMADVANTAAANNMINIQPLLSANVYLQLGQVNGTVAAGPQKTIVNPVAVTVSSGTAGAQGIAAGINNVVLYKAQISVATSAYANFTGISFKTKAGFAIADIGSGYNLYLSADSTFSTTTDQLIGTTASVNNPGTLNFIPATVIRFDPGSVKYLFVTASISPYAKTGDIIQIKALQSADAVFENSVNTGSTFDGNAITVGTRAVVNYSFPTPVASTLPCTSPNTPTTLPSKILNITLPPYNADPTGVADATAAFRLAVSQSNSFVYVPNGTYRLTDSVMWVPAASSSGRGGANVILWGESREGVTIKLDAGATGFGNIAVPKTFIQTGENQPQRFNNSIHNVTIEIGSGNPGAIGVRYYCNNSGGMYNVTVRSVDGTGKVGIDKGYSRANGPSLLKDVLVEGFDIGIQTDFSVESETMEHITLRNQKVNAFLNHKQVVTIRDLKVENCAGTALINETGHVTLLDSKLDGHGSAAIRNDSTAKMLLRNISTTGYTAGVADPQKPVSQVNITEWVSDGPIGRNGAGGLSLNLPIKETPVLPWDAPSTWVNVEDFGATTDGNCAAPTACLPCDDDAPKIQAAIDATLAGGSRAGATTLFLPGTYRIHSSIRLRGSIRRIVTTGLSVAAPYAGTLNGIPVATNFIVEGGTYPEIVIDNISTGFSTTSGCAGCQGITIFENNSGRTLVFRNSSLGTCVFNGGEVFFESVTGSRDGLFTFNNCNVWARQFDPERDAAKIIVNGGSFWALGLKTEGHGEIIVAKNNAKVEVFGGFVYSLSDSRSSPMFSLENAEASINMYEYSGRYGRPYLDLIKDVQNGSTVTLQRGAPSYDYPAPQPPQKPTYPANWSQRNDGTISDIDHVVGSNIVLYSNTNTSAIAGKDTTICLGNNLTTMAVPISSLSSGYTAKWSLLGPATGSFADSSVAVTTFHPTSGAGVYQLKWVVFKNDIAVSTDTVAVTVVSTVTAASNSGPYMPGDTIHLAATGSGTYNWTGPNGFISSLKNPYILNATTAKAGIYKVIMTQNGCTASDSTLVIVNSIEGLDKVGVSAQPSAAYSLRQLKTTYTHSTIIPPAAVSGFTNALSPVIRVRRGVDDALLDIGYTGNGDLDTVTVKNFAGAGNAFVVTWYDQGGGSHDVSQNVKGQQPFIVTSGKIERSGAKPAIRFVNSAHTVLQNNMPAAAMFGLGYIGSVFPVYQASPAGTESSVFGYGDIPNGPTYDRWQIHDMTGAYFDTGSPMSRIAVTDNSYAGTFKNYAFVTGINLQRVYVNGELKATATAALSGCTQTQFNIGGIPNFGTFYHDGRQSEILLYPSSFTDSTRQVVESNQAAYYGTLIIPIITAFTPQQGTSGSSVTINGKHFTGATGVKFGGVAATSFAVSSDSTINAVVGTGASGNVIVITPAGTASLGGGFFGTPLDKIGTTALASAAYSLRQLKTNYTHTSITPPTVVNGFTNAGTPLIRVRRSSDAALLDIGYTSSGDLDTLTLKNFAGVGNAYVVTWYDQSGSSYDVEQYNESQQPFIVTSGVIERSGVMPAIRFVNASHTFLKNNIPASAIFGSGYIGSVFPVYEASPSGTESSVFGYGDVPAGPTYDRWQVHDMAGAYLDIGKPMARLNVADNGYANSFKNYSFISGVNLQQIYVKGLLQASSALTLTGCTQTQFNIGGIPNFNTYYHQGHESEIIMYSNAFSETDRQTVESNQANYYFSSPGVINFQAMAVSLGQPGKSLKGNAVDLNWTATGGTGRTDYQLQKRLPGGDFVNIATVTGTGSGKYSGGDFNPVKGNNFYRIKATDSKGKLAYSDTVNVINEQSTQAPGTLIVYPNPFSTSTTVSFTLNQNETNVSLDLYNSFGLKISHLYSGPATANQKQSFNFNTPSLRIGVYFFRLTGAKAAMNTSVIIVN